jgi:REP element-mobilizing transposase RayT
MRYTPDFWASGYYVGTAGHVTAENVARYRFLRKINHVLEGFKY